MLFICKQPSNITTYLFSIIQYQCKSTCAQMRNMAVSKSSINSIHVQNFCGDIHNTLWNTKKIVFIGQMN